MLLPPEPLGRLVAWGGITGELVAVAGPRFDFAWHGVVRPVPSVKFWECGAFVELARPAAKGDCLALTFAARAVKPLDSGQGRLQAVFGRSASPFTSSLHQDWSLGTEWQDCRVAFRTVEDAVPGTHRLTLNLGFGAQELEVGNLRLTALGDMDPASTGLPEGSP